TDGCMGTLAIFLAFLLFRTLHRVECLLAAFESTIPGELELRRRVLYGHGGLDDNALLRDIGHLGPPVGPNRPRRSLARSAPARRHLSGSAGAGRAGPRQQGR